MTPEQEKFLKDIAEALKTQSGFNDVEQLFFPLRFDKNRPTLYKHKDIAENLMRPEGSKLPQDFYSKSIGTTMQNIVSGMVGRLETKHKKAISGLYKAEMIADGVDVDNLLNREPGERGSWEVVYQWLWNHKYLRWLDENGWQILQEKAISVPDWIQFKSQQEMASSKRVPKRPPASVREVASKITAHKALWMVVDLAYSNYQLLLFNRSAEGQYLLCPSLEFAPNAMIDNPPILLPQKGSWSDDYDEKEKFTFEVPGQEEFLAIVLEKPLKLDWLTPREEHSLPECNGQRFKELFDQLEKQENWQVFYQSFEVVE